MKYRRLGSTNLRVSVVGIGTWQFGGEWGKSFTQDEVDRILRRGHDLGINLIDTAECYGDHTSEALIGQAIQAQREKWIIATKFGHRFHGPFHRTDERSPADAVRQLEQSLRALRTDYVDILQYHSIRNEEFDNPELQQTLIRLKQQGKVRHIGNSISPNDNIHQTDASQQAQVQVIQVVYNRLDRKPEQRVFASCIRQNLGVLARVPLASGYLSGKYKPGARFDPSDVRSHAKPEVIDAKLAEVEKIAQTELPPGVPMATWALAWCLQHPAVTCVIPGCKSIEQVEHNAAAAELDIVRDDHPQAWK
ncbi:MAG TPA: aldo/keto reductase [Tepidisphaeraceae bacterium]|nr:aldo/keto reductase [Tepidisphaeraceae bacterium]